MWRQHTGYWFGWCAVTGTLALLLPWVGPSSNRRAPLALGLICASISVLVRMTSSALFPEGIRWGTRIWWAALGMAWTYFYLADLRHAQVQVLLVMVPVAGLIGALLARALVDREHCQTMASARYVQPRDMAACFMIVAAGVVWVAFVKRAHNGCTGVSGAYHLTTFITTLLVYTLGPNTIAAHLRSERRVHVPRPTSPYRQACPHCTSLSRDNPQGARSSIPTTP